MLALPVICKQRLLYGNEFVIVLKTPNAITLVKTVLKSPCKVLQSSSKEIILKRPVQFSKAVQKLLLTLFLPYIDQSSETTFLKKLQSDASNQAKNNIHTFHPVRTNGP